MGNLILPHLLFVICVILGGEGWYRGDISGISIEWSSDWRITEPPTPSPEPQANVTSGHAGHWQLDSDHHWPFARAKSSPAGREVLDAARCPANPLAGWTVTLPT